MNITPKFNINCFLDKDEILENEFKQEIVKGKLQVFTEKSINDFKNQVQKLIEKGEEDSLSLEENNWLEKTQLDLSSLERKVVVGKEGKRTVLFIKGNNADHSYHIPGTKGLPEGTIREWKGGKYIKQGDKWVPHTEGKGKQDQQQDQGQQNDQQDQNQGQQQQVDQQDQNQDQNQDQQQGGDQQQGKSPEDHAKSTPSDQLQAFISNPDSDPSLVQIAKQELINRGELDSKLNEVNNQNNPKEGDQTQESNQSETQQGVQSSEQSTNQDSQQQDTGTENQEEKKPEYKLHPDHQKKLDSLKKKQAAEDTSNKEEQSNKSDRQVAVEKQTDVEPTDEQRRQEAHKQADSQESSKKEDKGKGFDEMTDKERENEGQKQEGEQKENPNSGSKYKSTEEWIKANPKMREDAIQRAIGLKDEETLDTYLLHSCDAWDTDEKGRGDHEKHIGEIEQALNDIRGGFNLDDGNNYDIADVRFEAAWSEQIEQRKQEILDDPDYGSKAERKAYAEEVEIEMWGDFEHYKDQSRPHEDMSGAESIDEVVDSWLTSLDFSRE